MAATTTSRRIRRRGDEIIAHGRTNSENLHDFRWEDDEARLIREVTETFTKHEGKPPKGWLSGGSYENPWTADLLKEAGYTCICDWPADDQPFWMIDRVWKCRPGDIADYCLTLPPGTIP